MRSRAMAVRAGRSLRLPNYRLYFAGQVISMTGTWIQVVAEGWLVYQLTRSGVALGIATGLNFAPVLLFGAWAGVLADRMDKRRVLMSSQAAAAGFAATLAVLTATGAVRLWVVYVLAFALGCAKAIELPARHGFVMEIVGREDITNAVGLNTTVFTAARVVGPAIAAGLIATVGLAACFLVNALSFVAVIGALYRMDETALRRAAPVPRRPGQVREGLRYAWAQPVLRTALLMMAVIGTIAYNFRVLLPLLASEVFAGGAGTYALLSAVVGGGTLVGAVTAAARSQPSPRSLWLSATAFGGLMTVAGVAPTLAAELAVMVPLGIASMTFIATANATLQIYSADAMRGRVMALWSVVFLGSTPIGGPLVGWIAQQAGTRMTLVIAGAVTVATGLAVAWSRRPGAAPQAASGVAAPVVRES